MTDFYYWSHREELLAKSHARYRSKHPEVIRDFGRDPKGKDLIKQAEYRNNEDRAKKMWKLNHKEEVRRMTRKAWSLYKIKRDDLRRTVLSHYGDKCQWPSGCNSNKMLVVTALDGVKGRGKIAPVDTISGTIKFYSYIIRNGFPIGYRLLCRTHNMTFLANRNNRKKQKKEA